MRQFLSMSTRGQGLSNVRECLCHPVCALQHRGATRVCRAEPMRGRPYPHAQQIQAVCVPASPKSGVCLCMPVAVKSHRLAQPLEVSCVEFVDDAGVAKA